MNCIFSTLICSMDLKFLKCLSNIFLIPQNQMNLNMRYIQASSQLFSIFSWLEEKNSWITLMPPSSTLGICSTKVDLATWWLQLLWIYLFVHSISTLLGAIVFLETYFFINFFITATFSIKWTIILSLNIFQIYLLGLAKEWLAFIFNVNKKKTYY